jgi:hypothetical protein
MLVSVVLNVLVDYYTWNSFCGLVSDIGALNGTIVTVGKGSESESFRKTMHAASQRNSNVEEAREGT